MRGNVTAISQLPVEEFLGIQFQFLVTPEQTGEGFAFMKNVMPPHAIVPIHSHPSPEVFLVESGALDVYVEGNGWQTTRAGEVAWIPTGVRHALRTSGDEPMVGLHITSGDMYHFFHQDMRPYDPTLPPGPPEPQQLQKIAQLCAAYGGWMGSPEDNAAIGLRL